MFLNQKTLNRVGRTVPGEWGRGNGGGVEGGGGRGRGGIARRGTKIQTGVFKKLLYQVSTEIL